MIARGSIVDYGHTEDEVSVTRPAIVLSVNQNGTADLGIFGLDGYSTSAETEETTATAPDPVEDYKWRERV